MSHPPPSTDRRLSRERRLTASTRIREVLARGSRAAGSHVLVVRLGNDLGRSRSCVIVGKKVSKLAVRRNRIKRLIREAFRHSYRELPKGQDYVVVALARDVDWELGALRHDLRRSAQRAVRRTEGSS